MIVREMRDADCYGIINRQFVGRLASCAKDQPYVVPVQYVASGGLLYSFSMPGRKIDNMRQNPNVCLQVDEVQDHRHWKSVIIEGRYRELSEVDDCQQAWEVLQHQSIWWEPGALKPKSSNTIVESRSHLFYTISIDRMSGRQTAEE